MVYGYVHCSVTTMNALMQCSAPIRFDQDWDRYDGSCSRSASRLQNILPSQHYHFVIDYPTIVAQPHNPCPRGEPLKEDPDISSRDHDP
jgi:hypothetical protein